MMRFERERLLAYTAQRAKTRPEYLGWVLARFLERERMSEAELMQRLGIAAGDLPHLALCLRPRADHFIDDVRQISAKFRIDPTSLATVIRLVDSFEALADKDPPEGLADSGLLMAARARKDPPARQDDERRNHDHAES
jgi:hypothetical protein